MNSLALTAIPEQLASMPPEILALISGYLDFSSLLALFKALPKALLAVSEPKSLRKALAKIPFTRTWSREYTRYRCVLPPPFNVYNGEEARFLALNKGLGEELASPKTENLSRVREVLSTLEELNGMDPLSTSKIRRAVKGALALLIAERFATNDACLVCPNKRREKIEVTFGLYWSPPGTPSKMYQTFATNVEGWELISELGLELDFLGCSSIISSIERRWAGCPHWFLTYLKGSELASFRRSIRAPLNRPRRIVVSTLKCFTVEEVLSFLSMLEEEDIYNIEFARAIFISGVQRSPTPISPEKHMNAIWTQVPHRTDLDRKTVYSLTKDLKWTSQLNPSHVLKDMRRHLVVYH